MWINMKTINVYYIGDQQIKKCFEKRFFINSLKSNMFPKKFSDKTDEDLLQAVNLREKLTDLNNT